MSSIFSPVQKVADTLIGVATDIAEPILGKKTAAFLADPAGLKQPDPAPAALAPAAPVVAPVAPAEAPKSAAAAELAPAATTTAAVDEKKVDPAANNFAVRESKNVQRAAAASVLKTANEADTLGYVAPKKRGAARAALLG